MKANMKTLTWAVLAAILLAGCAQPLPLSQGGASRLTVKAGAAGLRTLMPTLGTYDLTLTSGAHATITVTGSTTGIFSLNVPDGNWNAQIDASVAGNHVASGSAQVSIYPGDSSSLDVPLVFDTAMVTTGTTGGIQLKIVTAASQYSVGSARWKFTDPLGSESTPAGTFNLADGSLSFNLPALASGSWVLDVVFFSDAQQSQPTARVHDQILVVDGASAYPDLVLAAEDFTAPGKVEMVAIAGGTFTYGAEQATVSPYWIGKYDVTQAQFQKVMGFNPSYFDNRDSGSHANSEAPWSPVESMTIWDAMEYTNRLSLSEGLDPVYTLTGVAKTGNSITTATVSTDLSRNGFRLPTDAEWEYAARAGNTTNDPFEGNSGVDYAWVSDNSGGRTHGVGQKLPNAWGLYDTWGNVFQLSNDWFDTVPSGPLLDYSGPAAAVSAPLLYSKVIRASGYAETAFNLSDGGYLDFRNMLMSSTNSGVGFRIARNQGTRVPNLNFDNLTIGDLNGQDGWVTEGTQVYNVFEVKNSDVAGGSGKVLWFDTNVGNNGVSGSRPLGSIAPMVLGSSVYQFTFDLVYNYWGIDVGIGSDLNGNGKIDTGEVALDLQARQEGGERIVLTLPDGSTPSQPLATPPGVWTRFELTIQGDLLTVRSQLKGSSSWSTLFSNQPMGTSTSLSTVANPTTWSHFFTHLETAGARLDNLSLVKLQQTQTTVRFETNGGSPVAPLVLPVGGRFTLPSPPLKAGYTFQGWYRDAALTDPWNEGTGTVTDNLVLYAGWTFTFAKRNVGVTGWWTSVAASADGTHLAAVENNFTSDIWTSTDSGLTWTNRTSATAPHGNNWRRIVSSSDGTHLAAAAWGGLLWTSSDSGITWTSRDPGIGNASWFDIATSADGTHLFAAVNYGDLWTSSDSGVTWVDRGYNQRWGAVASSADGSRLVAGVFGGSVWTSSDYGATWTPQQFLDSAFDSIASSADGQYLVQTGYEKLAVSSDFGATWTTQNDNAKSFGNVVISADGSRMTLVELNSGDLWTSGDYGSTWTNRTAATAAHSPGGAPAWTWGGLATSADGKFLVAGAGYPLAGDLWTGVLP